MEKEKGIKNMKIENIIEMNHIEAVNVRKLSDEMCSRLKEKRICLYGLDAWTRELMKNSLEYINGQNTLNIQILDYRELQDEFAPDLAIVIGEMEEKGGAYLEQLDVLMTEMEKVQKAKPEAAVYISDSRVYGKSFGTQVSRREEELGYVCHTSMDEMDRQCMRMAEHLVSRMAKEEHFPVKLVRLDQKPGAKELYVMMPYILGVLLNGDPGEVYNVTEAVDQQEQNENDQRKSKAESKPLSWEENRSPLTEMEIRMNTEKVRNYVASELFE